MTDPTYTNPRPGAVTRPLSDRAIERASVFDFIPVAMQDSIKAGTNTTDLSSYLTLACAAAQEVELPEFTFLITATVNIATGCRLFGAGTIQYNGTGNALNLLGSNIRLEGFTINGNNPLNTYTQGNHGVFASSLPSIPSEIQWLDNIAIGRLTTTNLGHSAIEMQWVRKARVTGNWCGALGRNGIYLWTAQDCHIEGNTVDTISPGQLSGAQLLAYSIVLTRSPQFRLADSPAPANCVIANNVIKNNTIYAAIDTHGGRDLVIANNVTFNVAFGINIEHGTTNAACRSISTSNTTIDLGNIGIAVDDYYNGMTLYIIGRGTSGPAVGTQATVTAYDGTTRIATVAPSLGTLCDTSTKFSLLESGIQNGVHNLAITGNKLSGENGSSSVEVGILVDANSGAGEISDGISITGNTLTYHGLRA